MTIFHNRILTLHPCSFRLTGLVSFMLSDEMTTGSVTTSDADKRVYASRSHPWNLQQRRFRETFPEVSTRCLCNQGYAPLYTAQKSIIIDST